MKKKTVNHEIDLSSPPALTAAQRAELKALRSRQEESGREKSGQESEIDYSEIPPLNAAFWRKAVRNPYYRPTKTSTTVRIDSDVLHWLRSHGKGYQSRMNAILRREMLTALKVTGSKHG